MEVYFMIEAVFCFLLIIFIAAFSLMLAFERKEQPDFSELPSPPSRLVSGSYFAKNTDEWSLTWTA